jgi:hypothetical protein
MDKKSKILFIIFFAAIFISVIFTFYRIFILKDYYIRMEMSCDPAEEKCFVRTCDPDSDSECPADVNERTDYYKIIEKKAIAIPDCKSENNECPEINCIGDSDCLEILCDKDTVIEGETCNDPENYIKQFQEENTSEDICNIDSGNCETGSSSPDETLNNL